MAVEIKKSSELVPRVNILCHGVSGVGKTYLCATAPKPLVVSSEEGLITLKEFDIDTITVKNFSDLDQAIKLAVNGGYQTLCLDSISDIAEQWLAEFKAEARDPRQAYGRMNDEISLLIRKLRNLPMYTYVISKQIRTQDDDTGIISYAPWMPGKTLNMAISYFFDAVVALRQSPKGERYIQTIPKQNFICKIRGSHLNEREEPNLTTFINKLIGEHHGSTTPKT